MSLDLTKAISSNEFLRAIWTALFGTSPSALKVITTDAAGIEKTGVCNGTDAVTPSNTVDLTTPGYFEVTVAGNVKFDPYVGAAGQTRAYDAKECSKFRVKRIYATGTTATGIVIYY